LPEIVNKEETMRCLLTRSIGMVLVIFVGCGETRLASDVGKRPAPAPVDTAELVILVGNSFIPPTEQLIAEFTKKTGMQATYSTGGSEDLLPHVKAKQRGDIFITHDPYLKYTEQAGACSDHVHVGFVAPVLAVQKGNPKNIMSISNLTKPGLKVALSDPKYSTCGEMVRDFLNEKGIYDAVMKNVGNRLTKGHSNLGNLLKTQAVDAVLMWNGVANTFKEHLEVIQTPYEYSSEIGVHIIGLSYSKQPELVRQFMTFVRERGETVFSEHGYVK
jgi:molybdate transport system substrate-binding protein